MSPLPEAILNQILAGVAIAALLLALVALAVGMAARRRAGRLERHYDALMTGVDGAGLAAALEAYVTRQVTAEGRLGRLEGQAEALQARMGQVVSTVRVTRYNAFEDTGGDQSFSVVFLNDAGDGAVITGLHSRTGVKVYAKPLSALRSPYTLSPQEAATVAPNG